MERRWAKSLRLCSLALYSHRRELFYDLIHLNAQGQQLITERLARDLAELMQRGKR